MKTEDIRLSRQPPAKTGDVLSETVLGVILFCSDCCNRILWTAWLMNNKNFPQFWRLGDIGKSKIKALVDSVSGEDLLPGP